MTKIKAMLFAAGLGTRLYPHTQSKPKALIPFRGKPLIQWVIEKLKSEGIKDFVINIHHFPEQMITFFRENNFNVNIEFSDETESLLETGGGIKKAYPLLADAEHILVHNCDILSNLNLSEFINSHKENDWDVSLFTRERETSRYLLFNESNLLSGWINKSSGQIKKTEMYREGESYRELAFSGIHLLKTSFIRDIEQEGKFSIIDTYLQKSGHSKIGAYTDNTGYWFDMGKPEIFAEAENTIP